MVKYLSVIFILVLALFLFVFSQVADTDNDIENETITKTAKSSRLNTDTPRQHNKHAPDQVDKKKFTLDFLMMMSKAMTQQNQPDQINPSTPDAQAPDAVEQN